MTMNLAASGTGVTVPITLTILGIISYKVLKVSSKSGIGVDSGVLWPLHWLRDPVLLQLILEKQKQKQKK